jgi:hypothetical protein
MRTATILTSRITALLVHAMLIAWIVCSMACGAKNGGDSTLLPGNKPFDAGSSTTSDAKATGGAGTMHPDAAPPVVVDASAPVPEAAPPKPTLTAISITPLETSVAPMGKVTLKVTGIYSDTTTNDVTVAAQFTSSDPKIASVIGGVVSALGSGKVTIIATYSGFVAFSNITVGEATVVSLSVSPSSLTVYSGSFSNYSVTAEATMSDGSRKDVTSQVTWTSSDPTVAPVSPSGTVQGLNPGTAKITATLGQIQASTLATVYGQMLKRISLQATPPVARPGDFVSIEVDAIFDKGSTSPITSSTTLESSNPSVLKLSINGNGIAMAVGKTTITAKLGDQIVGTVDVIVTTATLQGVEISPAKLTLDFPKHGKFTAYAVYTDQTRYDITTRANWYTDDGSIGSFDQNDGSFGPTSFGTTTVSAGYDIFTGTAQVTVTIGSPTSLTLGSDTLTSPNFGTFSDNANLNYADGTSLDVTGTATWISDDPSIVAPLALPDSPGMFLAGHGGNTKMRAKVGNMISEDCTVKVYDIALLAIDLGTTHIYTFPGSTENVGAQGTFQDDSIADVSYAVTWKTGNTAIATVSSDPPTIGQVTGVAKGTTSLTATLGSVTATTIITVN